MQEPARKKRRWDVAAPEAATQNVSNPPVPLPAPAAPQAAAGPISADALETMKQHAAAIAAKLARGPAQIHPQAGTSAAAPLQAQAAAAADAGAMNTAPIDDYIDIVINYAPAAFRGKLIKRPTISAIESRYHVAITVKGKFTPGDPPITPLPENTPEQDRPLFLRINSGEKDVRTRIRALAETETIISDILRGLPVDHPSPFFADEQGNICGRMYFGLLASPPEFDAPGRLTGPGNAYIDHITATTVKCEVHDSSAYTASGLQIQPAFALHISLTADLTSLTAWENFKKAHT